MLVRETVNGRPALVAYMTAFDGELTDAAGAKVAIVNYTDGPGIEFLELAEESTDLGNPFRGEGGRFGTEGDKAFTVSEAHERGNAAERRSAGIAAMQSREREKLEGRKPGGEHGPLKMPMGQRNKAGEAAFFIGWMGGPSWGEKEPWQALYNVDGGVRDRSTLSKEGLDEHGIPVPPTPKEGQKTLD